MPSNPELTRIPTCLDEVRIKSVPANAFYIADFLAKDEEQAILDKIASAPKPRWKTLTHRRLQTWPSDLMKDTLLESSLPPWLTSPIIDRILAIPRSHELDTNIFNASPHAQPNHVLINEYLPGQGIMPHKDGAAYYPVVCTVSLGASLCLDIYQNNEDGTRELEPRWRILQEPRSLLITTDDIYTHYFHGIADIASDIDLNAETVANWDLLRDSGRFEEGVNERETRTSLTYRDVIKVSKLGNKFAMFGKR